MWKQTSLVAKYFVGISRTTHGAHGDRRGRPLAWRRWAPMGILSLDFSSDSVCFLVGKHLISGDTVFPGGPGKTESPADSMQIIESITRKIFVLLDDTEISAGHGDPTLLSKEKTEFAIFSSRFHDPNLLEDVLWLSSSCTASEMTLHICHSRVDPESSLFNLDSCWGLFR